MTGLRLQLTRAYDAFLDRWMTVQSRRGPVWDSRPRPAPHSGIDMTRAACAEKKSELTRAR